MTGEANRNAAGVAFESGQEPHFRKLSRARGAVRDGGGKPSGIGGAKLPLLSVARPLKARRGETPTEARCAARHSRFSRPRKCPELLGCSFSRPRKFNISPCINFHWMTCDVPHAWRINETVSESELGLLLLIRAVVDESLFETR
jgi:hypothetical protein